MDSPLKEWNDIKVGERWRHRKRPDRIIVVTGFGGEFNCFVNVNGIDVLDKIGRQVQYSVVGNKNTGLILVDSLMFFYEKITDAPAE